MTTKRKRKSTRATPPRSVQPPVLNTPVAKPGWMTKEQQQRVANDRSLDFKIMSEPAPGWMQAGGSAGFRRRSW